MNRIWSILFILYLRPSVCECIWDKQRISINRRGAENAENRGEKPKSSLGISACLPLRSSVSSAVLCCIGSALFTAQDTGLRPFPKSLHIGNLEPENGYCLICLFLVLHS